MDYTLARWLRKDLTPEQEKAIFHAINTLKDKQERYVLIYNVEKMDEKNIEKHRRHLL